MKITLNYKGVIRIHKYQSGSIIEVPDRCNVRDLVSLLELPKIQQLSIMINGEPAWSVTTLKENDSVMILGLVGGG